VVGALAASGRAAGRAEAARAVQRWVAARQWVQDLWADGPPEDPPADADADATATADANAGVAADAAADAAARVRDAAPGAAAGRDGGPAAPPEAGGAWAGRADVAVLYATRTGHAERLAEAFAGALRARAGGAARVTLHDMSEIDLASWRPAPGPPPPPPSY